MCMCSVVIKVLATCLEYSHNNTRCIHTFHGNAMGNFGNCVKQFPLMSLNLVSPLNGDRERPVLPYY